jgi:hypothetical protein
MTLSSKMIFQRKPLTPNKNSKTGNPADAGLQAQRKKHCVLLPFRPVAENSSSPLCG